MKSNRLFLPAFVLCSLGFAQEKRDSLKTEFVHVISSFNPTISEASKIRDLPAFSTKELLKINANYSVPPRPIASAFEPNTGKYQTVEHPPKPIVFSNYIKAGYGTYNSPLIEGFVNHQIEKQTFQYTLFNATTKGGIPNSVLNNHRLASEIGMSYEDKRHEELPWEAYINYRRDQQNWYGADPELSASFLASVNEKQTYDRICLGGTLHMDASRLKKISTHLKTFSDAFESQETELEIAASFEFPIKTKQLHSEFDLSVLNTNFKNKYGDPTALNFGYLEMHGQAFIPFQKDDFHLSIGADINFLANIEKGESHLFFYPNVRIDYPIEKGLLNAYTGIRGGLKQNSYRELAAKNPFVSPTLAMLPTDNSFAFFAGVEGNLSNEVQYRVMAEIKNENNRALFRQNKALSDGSSPVQNGYELGNSFSVVYDQMQTFDIRGKIKAILSKKWSSQARIRLSAYTLDLEQKAWNLPTFTSSIQTSYAIEKWTGKAQMKFVGKRYDYSESLEQTISLKGYADLSVEINHALDERWTVFLNANNLLNNHYERFANFRVQGLQVVLGMVCKFDL